MKPRRETGAVLVSPMTSEVNTGDVNTGSVLIRFAPPALLRRRIQRILACELQITWLREAAHASQETRSCGNKKTRPSTQYAVNDLASPGN
jgi:hypothetical protein